ncbi:MAG: AI-2E family transporter [Chloroflexota bacterium]
MSSDGRRLRPPTTRVALVLFAAVAISFVLYLGRGILAPFVLGLLLVYLLSPAVDLLHRLRIPRVIAILGVYTGFVFLIVEAINLTIGPVVAQVSRFARDLPALVARLDVQLQMLSETYRGLALPPQVRAAIDEWVAGLVEKGVNLDPTVLLPFVNVTAGFVVGLFGYLIIPVWSFYLLKDRKALSSSFDRSLPPEWRADVWEVIGIVQKVVGQWVRGQVVLGVTVFLATFGGLLLLSELVHPVFGQFALLLAIIAGVLELLPVIGPIIAAIPAILLAATAGGEAVIAALVLYTVVQQVENYLLVPKIQGDAVRLHPSAVMFALILGASIAGLLGAILALPITAAARDVYRYLFRRLSPNPPPPALAAALALGEEQPAPPSPGPGPDQSIAGPAVEPPAAHD